MKVDQLRISTPDTIAAKLGSFCEFSPNLLLVFAAPRYFEDDNLLSQLKLRFPDAICVGCSTAGEVSQQGVDDVAFLRAVVDDATRKAPVDHRRVFVAGMSNGAMMALRMACQTSVFRGAASVAGTLVTSCDQPASVLQIHGTADRNVPYDGGRGSGFARVDGEAIPAIDARFRRLDACPAPAVSRSGKVTTSRADCPSGRKVELITVERMGHQWPSSPINATDAIWRYFSAL